MIVKILPLLVVLFSNSILATAYGKNARSHRSAIRLVKETPVDEALPEHIGKAWPQQKDLTPVNSSRPDLVVLSSCILGIVAAGILVFLWIMRKKLSSNFLKNKSNCLSLLQTTPLGRNQRLLVVEVYGERLLLAQHHQGINLLHHCLATTDAETVTESLPIDPLPTASQPTATAAPSPIEQSFADVQGLLRLKAQGHNRASGT